MADWLDSLRKRGHTTGTIRTRWRGLRRFTSWLVAEEILPTDPLTGISVDTPFRRVGPTRREPVFRALTRIRHPDNPATGDTTLQRELNSARDHLTEGNK